MATDPLPSWRDTPTRAAITGFVASTADVPPADRLAVFDNDGTLWTEKPLPVQAGFLFRRLAEQAQADPSLVDRQPWKAVDQALELAAARGWTVVSVRNDWATIFAD
jgi:hypothetical protein